MLERLAYLLKIHLPGAFPAIAYAGRVVTVLRFSRQRTVALAEAFIQGEVAGQRAIMRPFYLDDLDTLQGFLKAMPERHLAHFHPHGFGRADLTALLRSHSFMPYGLFVDDALAAYALLRLAPTGSAFIGLLVGPEHTGKGLGRFIVAYLYWQASLAGLRTRSTISRHNLASLKSHQAVSQYAVIAELPNNYLMIEFPKIQRNKPELLLP